jgi:hypothetical protein
MAKCVRPPPLTATGSAPQSLHGWSFPAWSPHGSSSRCIRAKRVAPGSPHTDVCVHRTEPPSRQWIEPPRWGRAQHELASRAPQWGEPPHHRLSLARQKFSRRLDPSHVAAQAPRIAQIWFLRVWDDFGDRVSADVASFVQARFVDHRHKNEQLRSSRACGISMGHPHD